MRLQCNILLTLSMVVLQLGISYGLMLSVEPENKVVELNQAVHMNCQAAEEFQVQYRWTHEGLSLPEHENQVVYSNGTLLIRHVTYDDVGQYICTVSATDGQVLTREVTLDIAYISTSFSSSPVSQTVLLGDHVTLTCMIDSLPLADIRWMLDGSLFAGGSIVTGSQGESILTLSPVLYSHVGNYKCVATNPVNNVFRYSLDATLVVQGQPVFLSSLLPVSIPIGYNATFTCNYHGNPAPEVTWYMHIIDDIGDVTSRELQTSTKYEVQDGLLKILDVNYIDEAFYTCTAGNVYGDVSESAELTVTGPARSPAFTTIPHNMTVTAGDESVLQCACTGNPQPSVYWKRGDATIEAMNGTYIIEKTQFSNADWYTCICDNDEGSLSQTVYLDVHTPPMFTQTPANSAVRRGNSLILQCVAIGNPEPTITWSTPAHGDDLTVSDSSSSVTVHLNGSLTLMSTSHADTGFYMCTARNVVASVTSSVTVVIQEAPVLTMLPVSRGVTQGQSVYLHCQASGVPVPMYTWSKDGEGTIVSSTRRQIYLNNTLVLHRVSLPDEGVYRCVARNIQGETQAVATLTVSVPPIFTTLPVNQTVHIGESVALVCFTDGVPVPTQWWLKDGIPLQLADNMVQSTDKSELGIIGLREDQVGIYTCVAANVAATVTADAWISLFDIPEFTVYPEDITVNMSSTLTLTCEGHATEVPSISWFKGLGRERTLLENAGRITVSELGHLTIVSISQADEDWYTCQLVNSVASVSHQAFVNVQVPPNIIHTNNPQTTLSQSEVTLTCQSTGDPSPTIQWINPDGHVISPNSTYIQLDHTLQIVSTNENDAGEWICKYCNILGCDTEKINVIIEGLPTIESITGTKTEGKVTLQCIVAGQPTPSVTFTFQGQIVTSDLEGHSVDGNKMMIEEDYLAQQYTCQAQNIRGTVRKSVTVPSRVSEPVLEHTGSSWVTLSWNAPENNGNLPLSTYLIQVSSGNSESWGEVMTSDNDLDLVNKRSTNITGLVAFTEYKFKVMAVNVLGPGESSPDSPLIWTLAGAPSPPTNVVGLQIDDGTVLLSWQPAANLHAPRKDVVYKYSLTKCRSEENIVLGDGVLIHNQTLQIEITGLVESVLYQISVWSYNTVLGLGSEPVVIDFDMTTTTIAEPETQTSPGGLKAEKVIAIVFGSIGGVVLVIVVAFIVTYIRHQRKTKSLSIVNRTLSLDQFYMENTRSLYGDDSKLSKRKSGISFYSFDESHHSNRSLNKAGKQSPHKGSLLQNDVLLVAKNPLYQDHERQTFLPDTDMGDFVSKRESTCTQGEIELKSYEIAVTEGRDIGVPLMASSQDSLAEIDEQRRPQQAECKTNSTSRPLSLVMNGPTERGKEVEKDIEELSNGHNLAVKERSLTPLSPKDLEEDLANIYGSVCNTSPTGDGNQSLEHVYCSIHSNSGTTTHNATVPIRKSTNQTDSKETHDPKPPIRVISPAYLRGPDNLMKNSRVIKSRQHFINSDINLNKQNHLRDTRSASPALTPSKLCQSNNGTNHPVRVVSLEHLRLVEASREPKLGPMKKHPAINGSCKSEQDFDGLENDDSNPQYGQSVNSILSAEHDLEDVYSGLTDCDKPTKRETIMDNFLTDEQATLESQSAELY